MLFVFDYQDYRRFLSDYRDSKRRQGRSFSVRGFLKKAGIANPSYYQQVIAGTRRLTEQTLEQFLHALQLPDHAGDYFRALVRFNQAVSSEEKQHQYQRMRELAGQAKVRTVGEQSYGFYEKWYIPVLRELLCLHPEPDNFAELGRQLNPPVPVAEVRQAVRRLQELGFVEKTAAGRYRQTTPLLTTGFEVHSMAVRAFNRQMVELAAESLDKTPVSERSVTGVTMAISPSLYARITDELRQMQERILKLVENDPEANRVYQLNMLLFPVSRTVPEGEPHA